MRHTPDMIASWRHLQAPWARRWSRFIVLAAWLLAACAEDSATTPTPTALPATATASLSLVRNPLPTRAPAQPTATVAATPGFVTGPTLAAAPTSQRPTPRGRQVLTITGPAEAPRTLDPALIRDAGAAFLARQVFSGLVRLDDRMEIAPDLADLPTISADGRRYTFPLRAGAVFQDGTPITAESVKASLERAANPALAGGNGAALPAATYLSDIDGLTERLQGKASDVRGVRVIAPDQVEITLAAPRTTFLTKLSHTTGLVVDARQAQAADWWRKPNGSGPFRLAEWRDGERIVFSRSDRYLAGRPSLEQVTVLLGASASQPQNLYEAGKIDFTSIGTNTVDRAQVRGSALAKELRVVPSLSVTYLAFNVSRPPFDDPRIRQAVARVIDRAKIAQVTMKGKATAATGMVPPPLPGADLPPAARDRPDVAAARQLLAASRYGANVPRLRIYASSTAMAVLVQELIQRDLGLAVDVIDTSWNDFMLGLEAREFDAYTLSWLADYPDAENFVEPLFGSGGSENYTSYANPALDQLLHEAAGEKDPAIRANLYRQAQAILLDDAVVVPLYHSTDYVLVKPYVKGLTVTPMGIQSLAGVWLERD